MATDRDDVVDIERGCGDWFAIDGKARAAASDLQPAVAQAKDRVVRPYLVADELHRGVRCAADGKLIDSNLRIAGFNLPIWARADVPEQDVHELPIDEYRDDVREQRPEQTNGKRNVDV